MAYFTLGIIYNDEGEVGLSIEYFTKAFELRERASERERLGINTLYYEVVTGELGKAVQNAREPIDNYPRDPGAQNAMGILLAYLGQYELARKSFLHAVELAGSRGTLCKPGLP